MKVPGLKLRSRFAISITVLVVPLAGAVAWQSQRTAKNQFLETSSEHLITSVENDRDVCEEQPEDWPRVNRRRRGRQRMDRRRGRVRASIFAYSSDFQSRNPHAPPFPEQLKSALEGGDEVALTESRAGHVLVAAAMPWTDGPCAIALQLRPAPPLSIFRAALIPGLIVALAAALISILVSGPLVRRIRKLTAAVKEQSGDVDVRGSDEIAELARAFQSHRKQIQTKIDELEARESTLRRYVANTTHDVMVPVSVLQGHLAALADAGGSAGQHRERVQKASEQAHYLGSLLHNLNAAAKLETDTLVETHTVDLGPLVERVVSRHRPLADQKSVEMNFSIPSAPVELQGDVTMLEQALGNLVLNAVRYNDSGGHVAVVLEPTQGRFELSVTDDGPGVSEEELRKLTDRGFRAETVKARTRGQGLGLAIAQEVCERHALELSLQSPNEGGFRAVIRPLA